MKLTIERMGQPKEIKTKYGIKPKSSFASGNKWYGYWIGDWNKDWKEGDTIEAEVLEREWEGKIYYDLKAPDPVKKLEEDVKWLIQKVADLEARLPVKQSDEYVGDEPPMPEEEF